MIFGEVSRMLNFQTICPYLIGTFISVEGLDDCWSGNLGDLSLSCAYSLRTWEVEVFTDNPT